MDDPWKYQWTIDFFWLKHRRIGELKIPGSNYWSPSCAMWYSSHPASVDVWMSFGKQAVKSMSILQFLGDPCMVDLSWAVLSASKRGIRRILLVITHCGWLETRLFCASCAHTWSRCNLTHTAHVMARTNNGVLNGQYSSIYCTRKCRSTKKNIYNAEFGVYV